MKRKLLYFSFSIIFLFAMTNSGFAKETEKDSVSKKKKSQVESVKKTTSVQKTDSNNNVNTTTIDNTATIDILKKLQNESIPLTSSSMTGEQINWQVISSGGVTGSSSSYILSGTIGQTFAGFSSSTNYQLNSGFWQSFSGSSSCCFVDRGNVNGGDDDGTFTGSVDISDLIYLVAYMFQGGIDPVCFEEADINGSGGDPAIDISDLIALVAFMFQGGIPPVSC